MSNPCATNESPFILARLDTLVPLWRPGATYVQVTWSDGMASGRMTIEPTGRRIYLRGRRAPPVGAPVEVREPRIAEHHEKVSRSRVRAVEPLTDPAAGTCTLWLDELPN